MLIAVILCHLDKQQSVVHEKACNHRREARIAAKLRAMVATPTGRDTAPFVGEAVGAAVLEPEALVLLEELVPLSASARCWYAVKLRAELSSELTALRMSVNWCS